MIISVVNQKGGTGKTTSTVNIGSALALKGKKVLLIDLDPQGSLSYSLGITDFEQSIVDVFSGEVLLKDILVSREGLDVAPSVIALADIELSMADEPEREQFLTKILSQVNGHYDYVLLDCPPSLSLLTINALCASQKVIIPMQMEVLSLQGLELIHSTIQRLRDAYDVQLEVLGVVPVLYDKRRKLSAEVLDFIHENYDLHVFKSYIRNNVKASEAPSFGQSVIAYDPQSNSAKDYINLVDEILTII